MFGRKRHDPLVAVVDFHHARGPEVEHWIGATDGEDPGIQNDWNLLPFMALSDGAHASTEDFSYFTLLRKEAKSEPATSLFGISCTRQIASSELIYKSDDVTRSTVQKAVVVVTDEPQHFGQLRERLSAVTSAWFAQKNFSDTDILKHFQESLIKNLLKEDQEKDQYLGLSLREMIHEFKYQTLVLFKACLLQPKILIFSSRCERLCMVQFSLITLIPGLIQNLQDCADPALESYAQSVSKATSLKTSDRSSLLAYVGLPLQLFGKGGFFGPYTPLQQLDLLADSGTKSYIVGSTNSLLLQQRDKYSDILVNLDETTLTITTPSLRNALALSAADRRWIDFLTQTVVDTWDPSNPSQPNTMGYMGSEEFIRLQFEEYLLALLSCVNYQQHLKSNHKPSPLPTHEASHASTPTSPPTDPSLDFGEEFINQWITTPNYALHSSLTADAPLFDIITPRHPTAGGLSVDDIQRRLAQQVSELHLDERMKEGREALNKTLATGQKHFTAGRERVSEGIGKLWADIEAMREAQRKRSAERSPNSQARPTDLTLTTNVERPKSSDGSTTPSKSPSSNRISTIQHALSQKTQALKHVDMNNVHEKANAARAQAGAYISSWGNWMGDRRRDWHEKRSATSSSGGGEIVTTPSRVSTSPTVTIDTAEKTNIERNGTTPSPKGKENQS